jgi:hypothetical protein
MAASRMTKPKKQKKSIFVCGFMEDSCSLPLSRVGAGVALDRLYNNLLFHY